MDTVNKLRNKPHLKLPYNW